MSIFQPGDLVTLRGMKTTKEKPIGMVRKVYYVNALEIIWINENISKRYALTDVVDAKKLEILSRVQKE
jgi:hypothetical protein